MNKLMALLMAGVMSMAVGCACAGGGSSCAATTDKVEGAKAAASTDTTSYDAASQVLTVTFAKGGTYTYAGVPQDVADKVAQAESKGKAINQLVKGKFEATKVK